MKILFLAYTSKIYAGSNMVIDRPDLTRKMSCLETWVPRVEKLGHEVVFFDGSNETQWYDEKNRILHTVADETYDDYNILKSQGKTSRMVERLKEAITWAIENKDFDYIFRTDDGTYVNSYVIDDVIRILEETQPDIVTSPDGCGRGGVFYSRKFCELFSKHFVNKDGHEIEDKALRIFYQDPEYNFIHKRNHLQYVQYIVGEKLFTIHYSNGKRQYLADDIISYYYTGNPIRRKVILGLRLQNLIPEEKHFLKTPTWNTGDNKTYLWYSFDKDENNWEYYGEYPRMMYCTVTNPCVFGKHSLSKLVLCDIVYDFDNDYQRENFHAYLDALTDDGILYMQFTSTNISECKRFETQHNLNTLDEYLEKLKNHVEIIDIKHNVTDTEIDAEFMQYTQGTFIKMKRKGV